MQPTSIDLFRSAAWSWGDNSFGASGLTLHSRASWPLPTPVELTKGNVSFVALGVGHTLAVTKRGHAYSWGRNEVGQLGVGDASRTTRALPSWVPLHSPVAMVAAGARHSVALLQDGSFVVEPTDQTVPPGGEKWFTVSFVGDKPSGDDAGDGLECVDDDRCGRLLRGGNAEEPAEHRFSRSS